jgi:crotonobetainyl-CoA:carnitine CoA-transferase CaiB-like acyl-CoA transferase
MPLTGIRVLDLSRLLPGPFCSQILGDFGADVIKVEDTGIGDLLRITPPFLDNVSARFLAVGRNKRSIALNLKLDGGKEVLRLAGHGADLLLVLHEKYPLAVNYAR